MSVIDPRYQVPPRRLLPLRHRRSKPHIYSEEEITRLMAQADGLRSANGMRALTLKILIGLLAAKLGEPHATKLALTPQALALLTDGVDVRGAKMRPWYQREG